MDKYEKELLQRLTELSRYVLRDPDTGNVSGITDDAPDHIKQELKKILWDLAYIQTNTESDKYFTKKPVEDQNEKE